MRDLSFQDALRDPDMPFQQLIQGCIDVWGRAVIVYEAAGSPNGPALEGDNVTRWILTRIEDVQAVETVEAFLALDSCTD